MPFMYLFYCFTIAYMKTIHYSWKFIQNYDNKEWKINHEYLLFLIMTMNANTSIRYVKLVAVFKYDCLIFTQHHWDVSLFGSFHLSVFVLCAFWTFQKLFPCRLHCNVSIVDFDKVVNKSFTAQLLLKKKKADSFR